MKGNWFQDKGHQPNLLYKCVRHRQKKNKSQNNPFSYFQRAMRYIIYQTCLLREIHCSNYFGAFSSSFVQKQKEMLAWMGICLEVKFKSILESPCNIKLWILRNSLLWNGENSSRVCCASVSGKVHEQYEEQFLSFSHKFAHPNELFTEVRAIIDAEKWWSRAKLLILLPACIVVYFAFNF